MDPGKQKQSAAAATDDATNNKSSPDADAALASYMQKAMRVDDLTLEETQQAAQQGYYPYYVAPTSLSLARPWAPQRQAIPHNPPLPQDLQVTRRFWPQTPPPPQPEPSEASRSSPGGFSVIGAYQYQSQSVASSSQPPPYTLSASQYYQPFASLPSAAASASSSSNNNAAQAQYYLVPVPAAAAHYQYQSGEASYAPDDFFLEPNQIQMRPRQTAQEALRLPDSPERVVRLLQDGDERTRQSVLHAVRSRVHAFMDSEEGHEVFVALLRACWDRPDELKAIVDAAVPPRPSYYSYGKPSLLLRASKHEYYWDASLKELITAVARHPDDLCPTLLQGLLSEGLLEHAKGEQLVQHCFATMRYEDTRILLRTAHYQFNSLLKSSLGSKCLVECFANARDKELRDFQQRLLADAVNIATGEYSNYFVQHALDHGSSDEFKQGLIEQLMADVEHLSLNQYGSYVVEKCLKNTGLLYRVLLAFLRLNPDQLANLVMGKYANYVVQKLLHNGRYRFPSETMMLAQSIERLPENVLENEYAKKVAKMSRKIVSSRRHRQYYG